jgi:uncharacterized protein (TIGR03663 family)
MIFNNIDLKNYFTSRQWLFFSLIILVGMAFRWYGLDDRPLHHDESLNAIYGRYFYEDPQNSFYQYDPLLHGPLLYHIMPFVYQVLGFSKFAIRFLPALLGSLFLFLPFIFRRYFSQYAVLLLTTFIAFSPSLIYWSRFLRHDYLIIASFFLLLISCCLLTKPVNKILTFTIGLTLALCTKENSYVTLAILLGFLIFDFFYSQFKLKNKNSYLIQLKKFIAKSLPLLPFTFGISVLIYCYFYSAGFRYSEGILDGLYRKSLVYWLQQHSVERISGPFIFHILSLSWYEFIFMLALIGHVVHFYKRCSWKYRLTLFFVLSFAFFSHLNATSLSIESSIFGRLLKLKLPIDFYPAFFLILHSFHVTIYHLNRKKRHLAFWGYFFFASFFTYSYVGEKVPWLSLYALIPGLIYLVYYFQDTEILRRLPLNKLPGTKIPLDIVLMAVLILFNLRMSLMTNFSRAGDKTEFISQVHTSRTYENIALRIQGEMETPFQGRYPKVRSLKENLWPLSWYLTGKEGYHYLDNKQDLNSYDYVFNIQYDPDVEVILGETHRRVVIPLRHLWLPDYKKMTWGKFFNYTFNHNPWNRPGSSNVSFFVKKDNSTLPAAQSGP